jgi:DNA-binding MarR family transcriptional regulator
MVDDPRWGDDPRDRDDDRGPHLGRGPSSHEEKAEPDLRGRNHERWPARDRDSRDRQVDRRDVFMRGLNLPRGREREIVHDGRDRSYTLRGSETRTLSTVGAFRVVPARELRDHFDRPADPRDGDLRHLREQGLIQTVRLDGRRDVAVTLTDRGRALLEANRDRSQNPRQEFYAGVRRERELEHDAQVYAAYLSVAERLDERQAHIERVLLDYELKREYQRWLHERDGDRDDYDGNPDRTAQEIEQWALEHELPYFDEQVHFPDLRIEYEEIDGRRRHEDVEVVTVHYRGAHGAAAARSGFSCYGGSSAFVSGRGRGGGRNGGFAEEFLK